MQDDKMCTVNARYIMAAIGNSLRPNGVYPNIQSDARGMSHDLQGSWKEIQLFSDVAQNLEVHLQDWGIWCYLAENFAGSVHQKGEILLGELGVPWQVPAELGFEDCAKDKHVSELGMHCTKDIGDYQSPSTGIGIELDVLAIRSSANTVESDRTLNCSVDAFHCYTDDAPLVVRQVYKQVYVPVGRRTGGWRRRVVVRSPCCACTGRWEVDEMICDAQVWTQDHVDGSVVLGT